MCVAGLFSLYMCQPGSIGFAERLSERFFLMTQDVERKSMSGFFVEAVYPTGRSRQLVCQGSRPRQQTTGLGRLSISVRLYTEQACCGCPSRHSGSSSAFKYKHRPLHWHDHYSWSAYFSETHIKSHQLLRSFWTYDGHGICSVHTSWQNLLLLPCGKLVVSLTRLEFFLHIYIHT